MKQNTSQVLVDAISLRTKKGPYNKLSKKKRLDNVRKLYFEEGYSIVDAAKTLGMHRNTVTADVKYWIGEFERQGGGDAITDYFYKQKSSLEAQKSRLLRKLKTESDFEKQYKLEKLLFGLYDREMKFYLKFKPAVKRYPNTSKELVKKIIRDLAFDEFSFFFQNELIKEIIIKTKCDVDTAHSIISEMENLGLDYARRFGSDAIHMIEFAVMCGCISDKECSNILQEITQRAEQEERD